MATPARKRVWEVDFVRGLMILFVVWDHFMWDVSDMGPYKSGLFTWLYELSSKYYGGVLRETTHDVFVTMFVFTSGVSCSFSRSNGMRAVKMIVLFFAVHLRYLRNFRRDKAKFDHLLQRYSRHCPFGVAVVGNRVGVEQVRQTLEEKRFRLDNGSRYHYGTCCGGLCRQFPLDQRQSHVVFPCGTQVHRGFCQVYRRRLSGVFSRFRLVFGGRLPWTFAVQGKKKFVSRSQRKVGFPRYLLRKIFHLDLLRQSGGYVRTYLPFFAGIQNSLTQIFHTVVKIRYKTSALP